MLNFNDLYKQAMLKTAAKNERWLQQAEQKMERKGTKGAFTDYCKRKGYTEVTWDCIRDAIKEAKETGNLKLLRRAIFAKNVHLIARKRKKSAAFVEIEALALTHLETNNTI